jgi:hypothetical protein
MRTTQMALALVALTASACGEGETCDGQECETPPACEEGSCVDVAGRFPAAVGEGFSLVDLGEVTTLEGETEDLTIEVPEGASVMFLVGVARGGQFVVPLRAQAPDGTEVIVPEADVDESTERFFAGYPGPATSENRAIGRPRAAATIIPNTPRVSLQSGTWTVRFGLARIGIDESWDMTVSRVDGPVRVGAVLRDEPVPETGRISVTMTFHPSSGLDAASAEADSEVQRAIELLDEAFGPVGVTVDEVVLQDTDADLPAVVDLGSPNCLTGDVPLVFDRVPEVEGAVHIVFVGGFKCETLPGFDIGPNLGAVSNGVPGLPFATRDGIVVSTQQKAAYPEDWARVIAHEVGHYLGLTHTVEGLPSEVFDNIADTSESDPVPYLMYFNATDSQSSFVTPDQGSVIRAHPLVR